MKKIVIIGLNLVLILALSAFAVTAQGPGVGRGFGMGPGNGPPGVPFLHAHPKGACRLDPSVTFTEHQGVKLVELQRTYSEEARPLWSELRDLRLELRFALSDPQIPPQALLDKQRKFSDMQARLANLLFSYQLKARAIFTQEQFERLPANCPLKMGPGFGIRKGMGKGPQKGIR
jgi:Spy/CpxP family protein refolding chaperone